MVSHSESLTRAEIRQLKKVIRSASSPEAAEQLLADSVRKGHDKLALHRYLTLHLLDASRCRPFEDYCLAVARRFNQETLQRVFRHVGWNQGYDNALPTRIAGTEQS